MKKFSGFAVLVSLFLVGIPAKADGWTVVTAKVETVGTSWEAGYACIFLEGDHVAKVDLASEHGKAQFTLAVSAFLSGRSLQVAFAAEEEPVGGCNTGDTIKPHGGFIGLTQ